jgi:hypothetical protein
MLFSVKMLVYKLFSFLVSFLSRLRGKQQKMLLST